MKIYEAWDELKEWLFILQDDLIPADCVRAKMENLEYKYE